MTATSNRIRRASAAEPLKARSDAHTESTRDFDNSTLTTDSLKTAVTRVLGESKPSALHAWIGRAGTGKSTAAHFLMNAWRTADKGTARRIEVAGNVLGSSTRTEKSGLREVYDALIGPMSSSDARVSMAIRIRADIVAELGMNQCTLLVIDEASKKNVDELRGIAQLVDAATEARQALTIVLVGTPELWDHLDAVDHLKTRIDSVTTFAEWEGADVQRLANARIGEEWAKLPESDQKTVGEQLAKKTSGCVREVERILRDTIQRRANGCPLREAVERAELNWERQRELARGLAAHSQSRTYIARSRR